MGIQPTKMETIDTGKGKITMEFDATEHETFHMGSEQHNGILHGQAIEKAAINTARFTLSRKNKSRKQKISAYSDYDTDDEDIDLDLETKIGDESHKNTGDEMDNMKNNYVDSEKKEMDEDTNINRRR